EDPPVARRGERGGEGCLARRAVIRVVDVLGARPAKRRVLADDDVGTESADLLGDGAPQRQRRLQETVFETEKPGVATAEPGDRGALLALADRPPPLGRHRRVVAALAAVRAE